MFDGSKLHACYSADRAWEGQISIDLNEALTPHAHEMIMATKKIGA